MITEYIQAAMRRAKFEHITGEGLYFGKIAGFKGLWASGNTKRACAFELRERLHEWIALSLQISISLPALAGLRASDCRSLRRA